MLNQTAIPRYAGGDETSPLTDVFQMYMYYTVLYQARAVRSKNAVTLLKETPMCLRHHGLLYLNRSLPRIVKEVVALE